MGKPRSAAKASRANILSNGTLNVPGLSVLRRAPITTPRSTAVDWRLEIADCRLRGPSICNLQSAICNRAGFELPSPGGGEGLGGALTVTVVVRTALLLTPSLTTN